MYGLSPWPGSGAGRHDWPGRPRPGAPRTAPVRVDFSTPIRGCRLQSSGFDEAFRDTLETESSVSRLLLHGVSGPHALRRRNVPQSELQTLLRRKYGSHDIDLIVAAGSRALRVALQNRTDLFSGAPVVFLGVDRSSVTDLRLSLDVTGTWLRQNWAETLELARRLQPDVRKAIVVAGSGPNDLLWLERSASAARGPPPSDRDRLPGGRLDPADHGAGRVAAGEHGRPGRRLSA